MNAILEKIKEVLDSLTDKVQSFYEENKKLAIIIASMFVVILVCLILLVTVGKKDKKKTVEVPGQKLEFTERLFVPDGPALPRDYTVSRKTSDKWSAEEAEPYFTVPADKEIESLANANDNMINEIIGAAP